MTVKELFQDGIEKPKVGTRILLSSGKVLLVGDLNTSGGICDDCTWWHHNGDANVTNIEHCTCKHEGQDKLS